MKNPVHATCRPIHDFLIDCGIREPVNVHCGL